MFIMLATKHKILKWASRIFGPLGLISPVTINAKLFLQQLWQQSLKWDTQLSKDLSKNWYKITSDITQATAMPFPCQCCAILLPSSPTEVTLHIFADASPRAYEAVAYLEQGTQSAILMSKSRAAPLKQHTLPRLELRNNYCTWYKIVQLYLHIYQC